MIDRQPDRESTRVVAIRGAIDVPADTAAELSTATIELVRAIHQRNRLDPSAIISAQFTVTPDLRSIFPAKAAREAGWSGVPMLCTLEIDVPGVLPRCIRVMIHANMPTGQGVEHDY